MIKKYLALIALTTATPSIAGNYNLKYGLGMLHAAKRSHSDSIFGSLGYQERVVLGLHQQFEGGLWTSRVEDLGQKTSGFFSYSLGTKLDLNFFYIESMHGIGLITAPDSLLGGPFQFFHDIGLGFKDELGSTFGIQWKHVSSAGLEKPNIGRDFLLVKVSLQY